MYDSVAQIEMGKKKVSMQIVNIYVQSLLVTHPNAQSFPYVHGKLLGKSNQQYFTHLTHRSNQLAQGQVPWHIIIKKKKKKSRRTEFSLGAERFKLYNKQN